MCAAALEAFAFGVVVCDRERRIVYVNSIAAALARTEFGYWRAGTVVTAGTRPDTFRLTELIEQATRQGMTGVARLHGRAAWPWIIARVAPLSSCQDRSGNDHALIALRPSEDEPPFDEETLVALFRLSPAQAEIALSLYAGSSLEEIAAERNVKISTLRTHLAEIFARSGTETQLQLVRLLSMLPPLRASRSA